jgi:hypothetical protein
MKILKMGVTGILAIFVCVPYANADVVKLKNGGEVQGIVKEEDSKKVVVETGTGQTMLSKDDILSIRRERCSLHEYYEKYETIKKSENAEDFFKLSRWCKANNVPKYTQDLLQRTLELNPNHEFARREMGFILYNGKWMTREEVMLAKGYILYKGKWMSPAEKEILVGKELESELRAKIEKELLAKYQEEEKIQREIREREEYRKSVEREQRLADLIWHGAYFFGYPFDTPRLVRPSFEYIIPLGGYFGNYYRYTYSPPIFVEPYEQYFYENLFKYFDK